MWGGPRQAYMDDLLQRFAAANPDLRLEPIFVPPEKMREKVLAAAADGSLPEVFAFHTDWYSDLDPAAHLAALGDFAATDHLDLPRLIRPQDLARCQVDGVLRSLPATVAGGIGLLYVNQRLAGDLGPEAFRDWAAFTAASRDLVARLNPDGQLRVIAVDPFLHTGMLPLVQLCFGHGAPTVDEAGHTSRFDSAGIAEVAAALDAYVDTVYGPFGGYRALLAWRHVHAGLVSTSTHHRPFCEDKAAFHISANWAVALIRHTEQHPPFAIHPLPGLRGPHGGVAANAWSFALRHDAGDSTAAWRLLRWLTIEPDGNPATCVRMLRPAPIIGLDDDPAYLALGQAWDGLRAAMALDIPWPGPIHEHALNQHLIAIPVRRAEGEDMAAILASIHRTYQDYLDQRRR